MGKFNILLVVLLIVTTTLAEGESSIIFNSEEIHAKPNEKVQLDCGINGTYRYCIWEHADEIFQTADIYENTYPGKTKPEKIEDNQCGIVLDSASTEDHGEWTCKVFIKGGSLVGSKNVTIPVKPTQAKITPAEVTANAGEETKIECSVMAARPAVQIKWLLVDEDITENAKSEDTDVTQDGTIMTVSTLKRNFTSSENEMELKCVVDHPTLEESDIVIVPVNVVYAPVENNLQVFYELKEGDDYEIKVEFSANPKPSKVVWQYGDSFDTLTNEVEIPLKDEKMMTKLESWVNETFKAVLKISSLNATDFERKYNLFVENEIGATSYHVTLSKDKAPMTTTKTPELPAPEPVVTAVDATIIAIIAVVAIIVVAAIVLLTVFFLRRSQKGCFAPKAAESDTEKEEEKTDAEKGVTSNGKQDEESKLIEKTELNEKEDKNGNAENGDVKEELVENGVTVIENSNEISDKNEKNGSV